jgi:hypothetical protein
MIGHIVQFLIKFLILIFHNLVQILIYNCLCMLPHTVIVVCTFELRSVELLVEMLLLLIEELDLLIDAERDSICYCFSILLFASVDSEADVFGL